MPQIKDKTLKKIDVSFLALFLVLVLFVILFVNIEKKNKNDLFAETATVSTYAEFQTALSSAVYGDTINIEGEITVTSNIEINKSITLAGDFTIELVEGCKIIVWPAVDLVVDGLTISGIVNSQETGVIVVGENASLTLNEACVNNNAYTNNKNTCSIYCEQSAMVTLNQATTNANINISNSALLYITQVSTIEGVIIAKTESLPIILGSSFKATQILPINKETELEEGDAIALAEGPDTNVSIIFYNSMEKQNINYNFTTKKDANGVYNVLETLYLVYKNEEGAVKNQCTSFKEAVNQVVSDGGGIIEVLKNTTGEDDNQDTNTYFDDSLQETIEIDNEGNNTPIEISVVGSVNITFTNSETALVLKKVNLELSGIYLNAKSSVAITIDIESTLTLNQSVVELLTNNQSSSQTYYATILNEGILNIDTEATIVNSNSLKNHTGTLVAGYYGSYCVLNLGTLNIAGGEIRHTGISPVWTKTAQNGITSENFYNYDACVAGILNTGNGEINIADGTINVTGGNISGGYSYGIYTYGRNEGSGAIINLSSYTINATRAQIYLKELSSTEAVVNLKQNIETSKYIIIEIPTECYLSGNIIVKLDGATTIEGINIIKTDSVFQSEQLSILKQEISGSYYGVLSYGNATITIAWEYQESCDNDVVAFITLISDIGNSYSYSLSRVGINKTFTITNLRNCVYTVVLLSPTNHIASGISSSIDASADEFQQTFNISVTKMADVGGFYAAENSAQAEYDISYNGNVLAEEKIINTNKAIITVSSIKEKAGNKVYVDIDNFIGTTISSFEVTDSDGNSIEHYTTEYSNSSFYFIMPESSVNIVCDIIGTGSRLIEIEADSSLSSYQQGLIVAPEAAREADNIEIKINDANINKVIITYIYLGKNHTVEISQLISFGSYVIVNFKMPSCDASTSVIISYTTQ